MQTRPGAPQGRRLRGGHQAAQPAGARGVAGHRLVFELDQRGTQEAPPLVME